MNFSLSLENPIWNPSLPLALTELLALSLHSSHQFHPLHHPLWALPLTKLKTKSNLHVTQCLLPKTFNALLNKSHPFPSCYPESEDEPRQPSSSSRRDFQPLLLHPKHFRSQSQADTVTLHRQHQREHFYSRARAIKRPRFNRRLQYELKPEFSSWEITHWDSSRLECTLKKVSLPSQQILVPLKAITAKQN